MLKLTNAQKTCSHVFVGRADGVHCTRCGLHLTPQQYHELLHPPEGEQNAAPDKEPAGDEKPTEGTAEAPQARSKRPRKKKEANTGE